MRWNRNQSESRSVGSRPFFPLSGLRRQHERAVVTQEDCDHLRAREECSMHSFDELLLQPKCQQGSRWIWNIAILSRRLQRHIQHSKSHLWGQTSVQLGVGHMNRSNPTSSWFHASFFLSSGALRSSIRKFLYSYILLPRIRTTAKWFCAADLSLPRPCSPFRMSFKECR